MAKREDKKSRKIVYLWIVFVVVVLIAALAFILSKDKEKQLVTDDKSMYELPEGSYVDLNLDYEVDFLTKCLTVSGIIVSKRPEELKSCPVVNKEDIKILKYLNNASGEIVCNSFGANDGGRSYNRCYDLATGCNRLLRYDWVAPGEKDIKHYYLYQCKDQYYYSYYHDTPEESIFVDINFDWKTYNKIVYGIDF